MPTSTRTLLVPSTAGPALLVACFIAAPPAIQASCGDYLRPLMPGVMQYPSGPAIQHPPMVQHRHAPCSGLYCSPGKVPGSRIPAILISLDRDNAVVVAHCLPLDCNCGLQSTAKSPVRAVYQSMRVYHPPRSST